jgi:putative FmdB family regulatory protein
MPMYEYYCDRCDREVTLTLSISEHQKGRIQCPRCGGKSLRPLLSTLSLNIAEILNPRR